MNEWRHLLDRAQNIAQMGRKARLGRPGLAARVDVALAGIIVLFLAGGAGLGWTLANLEAARGYLDPPLLSTTKDRRILKKYTDHDVPFSDAIAVGDRVVMARQDGMLHWYHPDKELFQDQSDLKSLGFSSPIDLLAPDCPQANGLDCASEKAFAVTRDGGLAAGTSRRWVKLLGDDSWVGLDGNKVEQGDVETWAISSDGRWLLASAGEKGMTLFDQTSGTWVPIDPSSATLDPNQIIYAKDRFWLATDTGLQTLEARRGSSAQPVSGSAGKVLDVTVTPKGDLLALEAGGCSSNPACLQLLVSDGADTVRLIAGGGDTSPTLSNLSIEHAAMQARHLVVLGQAGIHAYDTRLRQWKTIHAQPVDALHANKDGSQIHFASGDLFASIQNGALRDSRQIDRKVRQILPLSTGQILALDHEGRVFDMAPKTPLQISFVDPGLPDNVSFETGALLGNRILFAGAKGALIHDPVARRYAFDPSGWPAGFPQRGARLVSSGTLVWLVSEIDGRIYEVTASGDWPNVALNFRQSANHPGGIAAANATGSRLTYVAKDARPYQVTYGTDAGPVALFGNLPPSNYTPRTMAAIGDLLVFSDGTTVVNYDLAKRSWSQRFRGPNAGIADLDLLGTPVALSPDQTVSAVFNQAWRHILGGTQKAAMSLEDVTDAKAAGSTLWIGGRGSVQAYLPNARQFGTRHSGGQGEVRILRVIGNRIFWTSAGKLFVDDAKVSENGETVLGAWFPSDELFYLAEQSGQKYAVRLDGQDKRCLFRGNSAPRGDLLDARKLPDGRVIATTSEGAGIYNPTLRRWTRIDGLRPGSAAYLEILGGHLVHVDTGVFNAIPHSAIPEPDSCATGPVSLDWTSRIETREISVDPGSGTATLLHKDGRISIWSSGQERTIVPATKGGPNPNDLKRVYSRGSDIAFAASRQIWTYLTKERQWYGTPFSGGPANPTEIDLGASMKSGAVAATLWDSQGKGWGGNLEGDKVSLSALSLPSLPAPQLDPSQLRDVARSGQSTVFVGLSEIEIFDKLSAASSRKLKTGAATRGWQMAKAGILHAQLLVDGSFERPETVYVLPDPDKPAVSSNLRQAAFSYTPTQDRAWGLGKSHLWRIDNEQRFWKCPITAGRSADQTCIVQAPPPSRINKRDVEMAVPAASDGWVFATSDGVFRIGAGLRNPERFDGLSMNPAARLIEYKDHAYFWEGPGGALAVIDGKGAPTVIDPEILDLAKSPDSLIATRTNGAFQLVGTGLFRPGYGPAGQTQTPMAASTLSATGDVFGLDDEMRVRRMGSGASPAPGLQLPANTIAVLPGRFTPPRLNRSVSGWWYQTDSNRLFFAWSEKCTRRVYPESLYPDSPRPDRTPAKQQICNGVQPTDLILSQHERVLDVAAQGERLTVTTQAHTHATQDMGKTWSTAARQDTPRAVTTNPTPTAKFRDLIKVVDRIEYLAPPVLEQDSAGKMRLGPVGSQADVVIGETSLTRWRPLDIGWLKWNRQRSTFSIGAIELSPSDALRDKRFITHATGKAAFLGGRRFAWLNEHGLWHIDQGGRSIKPVRVEPTPPAIGLARGVFLFESGGMDARTGQIIRDQDRHTIKLGELEFVERLRSRQVSANWTIENQPMPAWSNQGFAFDDRRDVALHGERAVVLTPIGIVPATAYTGAMKPAPKSTALDLVAGLLMAKGQGGWHRRTNGAWSASSAPRDTMALARENGRVWARTNGRAAVTAANTTESWRHHGSGLGFDADRLIALAADTGGIVAVTGIGTVTGSRFADLATLAPAVTPDPGALNLDALDSVGGIEALWAETGSGRLVWDASINQWRNPQTDETLWDTRVAVRTGGLTIAFSNGRPAGLVTVEDLGGSSRDAPFSWSAGHQMPFDRATGIHAEGNSLLVTTEFGLRRLSGSVAALGNDTIFSGVGTGQPVPHWQAVGRPDTAPDKRVALSAAGLCLTFPTVNAAPVVCDRPYSLNQRRVLQTGFWHWTKSDRAVTGHYRDRAGALFQPLPRSLRQGWPHDQLASATNCGGKRYELWSSGSVIATHSGSGRLVLDVLKGANQLHCQRTEHRLDGAQTLKSGLYALGQSAAWHASGARWAPAPQRAVADRADGRLVWSEGKLSTRLENGKARAEHYWLDDKWRELTWGKGRMAIDRIVGLARGAGQFHALTQDGMISVVAGQSLEFVPNQIVLHNATKRSAFSKCTPREILTYDGDTQSVPARSGAPVTILCADGSQFEGQVDGQKDLNAFHKPQSDLAADRIYVDTDLWRWTRKSDAGSSAMTFDIQLRDEPAQLAAGRFDFDDWAGVASPFASHTEIVTNGSGWWRQTGTDFALAAMTREPNEPQPEAINKLTTDFDGTRTVLCIADDSTRYFDDSGTSKRAPVCRSWRGTDNIWSWYSEGSKAIARGQSLSGLTMTRSLSGGRFSDLVVTGAPVSEDASKGSRILAPTKTGVVLVGKNGPVAHVLAPEGAALTRSTSNRPLVVSRQGTQTPSELTEPDALPRCAALAKLPASLPDGSILSRVIPKPRGRAEVLVQAADSRDLLLVPCEELSETLGAATVVDVSDRHRHQALGRLLPGGEVVAWSDKSALKLRPTGGKTGLILQDTLDGPLLAQARPAGAKSMILITRDSMFTLDLDRALSRLADTPVQIPAPKGPFYVPSAKPASPQPQEPVETSRPPTQTNTTPPTENSSLSTARQPIHVPSDPPSDPSVDRPVEWTPNKIRALQTRLKDLGHYKGRIDGIIGRQSRQAIRDWQASRSLPVNGQMTEYQFQLLTGETQ